MFERGARSLAKLLLTSQFFFGRHRRYSVRSVCSSIAQERVFHSRLMGFNYDAIYTDLYSMFARHILFCCLRMQKFFLFEMTRLFTVQVALCLDILK